MMNLLYESFFNCEKYNNVLRKMIKGVQGNFFFFILYTQKKKKSFFDGVNLISIFFFTHLIDFYFLTRATHSNY